MLNINTLAESNVPVALISPTPDIFWSTAAHCIGHAHPLDPRKRRRPRHQRVEVSEERDEDALGALQPEACRRRP